MLQKKYSVPPQSRSGPGAINVGTLARAAVVIAAGLGLAACVGPYVDDGYGYSQRQYRGPSYDTGYDQRRGSAYRQYPYASPDQQRWNYSWWRGPAYSRDRFDD